MGRTTASPTVVEDTYPPENISGAEDNVEQPIYPEISIALAPYYTTGDIRYRRALADFGTMPVPNPETLALAEVGEAEETITVERYSTLDNVVLTAGDIRRKRALADFGATTSFSPETITGIPIVDQDGNGLVEWFYYWLDEPA